MPDSKDPQAPDATQGTLPPDPPAPDDGAPGTSDIDWEADENVYRKRYNDLRPEVDRTRSENQELQRYRDLWNAAQQGDPEALAALNLELTETEPEPDDYQDPYAQLQQQVQELQARMEQEQQQQAYYQEVDQEFSYITDQLEQIEQKLGRELGLKASNTIGQLAQQMRDEHGQPDVQGAYKAIYEELLAEERTRQASKPKPTAPPTGSPGANKVNLKDPQSELAYLAAGIEADRE